MNSIGIDIGSVSISLVVMGETGDILKSLYVRHKGRPIEVTESALENLLEEFEIDSVAVTGTGAKEISLLIGASFINEIVAISKGFTHLYPHVRSIIDIGGEDSKLIILEEDRTNKKLRIKDFSMNALCAAGTGSFLDQQASRLCFTIEEFSERKYCQR